MKKPLAMLCAAFAMLLAGEAKAELFKCVKDGKTTYQEQPCGGQGAETKIQTAKPSSRVGCYESKGSTMEGNRRQETSEVRHDGSTLYISTGREGNEETRILLKPATTGQLEMFKQSIGLKGGDVQVTSGLV